MEGRLAVPVQLRACVRTMLAIALPPTVEQRLDRLAWCVGGTEADFAPLRRSLRLA